MEYRKDDRVEYRGMHGIVEKVGPGTAVTVRFGTVDGHPITRMVPADQLSPGQPVVSEEEVHERRRHKAQAEKAPPARPDDIDRTALRDGYGGSAPAL